MLKIKSKCEKLLLNLCLTQNDLLTRVKLKLVVKCVVVSRKGHSEQNLDSFFPPVVDVAMAHTLTPAPTNPHISTIHSLTSSWTIGHVLLGQDRHREDMLHTV